MAERFVIEDAAALRAVLADMPFGAIAYNAAPGPRLIDKATPEERGAWLVRWLRALNETLEGHVEHDGERDRKLAGYEEGLRGVGRIIGEVQTLLAADRLAEERAEERGQAAARRGARDHFGHPA